MAITRYRDPANLFGLQRLNRILDEAFAGLPFPESSVVTSTLFAPTDVSEDENALQSRGPLVLCEVGFCVLAGIGAQQVVEPVATDLLRLQEV